MSGLASLKTNKDPFLEKGIVLLLNHIRILLENDPGTSESRYVRELSDEEKQVIIHARGVQEILIEIGYSWFDDRLYISPRASQQRHAALEYQNELRLLQLDLTLKSIPLTKDCESPPPLKSRNRNNVSNNNKSPWYRHFQSPAVMGEMERGFYGELKKQIGNVLMHEDKSIQEEALQLIPVERLTSTAAVQLASISEDEGNKNVGLFDVMLMELLRWFKEEFFTWISPECERCKVKCSSAGLAAVTADDRRWGAHVVEKHQCPQCGTVTLFPRYNHPAKLLQTRVGRCGEWANCFTLCCRALGYDARMVFDFTDHVWTEVYSESQKRWLHCDSCETLCDSPLVYEQGWGKQLAYVIAVSAREMRDVTFRYTTKWPTVLARRNRCREPWLIRTLGEITESLQAKMSAEDRGQIEERFASELVDLLTPRDLVKDCETGGRVSGDLAWRLMRNEIRSGGYVFEPSASERRDKRMRVAYSCATNKYLLADGKEVDGWEKCTARATFVFRKVEHDWKQCYLARTEGSQSASVNWVFDFGDLRIDTLRIRFETKLYESGTVLVTASSESGSVPVFTGPEFYEMTQHRGSRKLTVSATMLGGKGSVAWQHAQLFRQSLDDRTSFPFEIIVTLT